MNSVRCAYFGVSLRGWAIHSSRWVDFADLVGLRFFFSIGKDDASFYQLNSYAHLRVLSIGAH
jgi:hypothetical protein